MSQKNILAFGNPVYDRITTPSIQRQDRILSGCSTNACLAVAKIGEKATLVGTVGPDFTEIIRSDLGERGIGIEMFSSHQTGGFQLVYDDRGDRELTVLGIADPLPLSANGYGADEDFILLGPILGEIPVELVKMIKAKSRAPILLDPQGLLRGIRDGQVVHESTNTFKEIAGMSTIVKANEIETITVTGIDPRKNPEKAVRALYKFGCPIAVVTLAEAGSVIYDGERIYTIPPYRTDAIDPTGAGDTYAAGFMVRYLETKDLTEVGCFASAVASIMVENSGPDFELTRAEVERRAASLLNGPLELKPTH